MFRQEITRIDNETNQLNKRYAEIESLVKIAEERPKPSDVEDACATLRSNMGKLSYEDRRQILELLRIKILTGKAISIEGVLPIASTVDDGI